MGVLNEGMAMNPEAFLLAMVDLIGHYVLEEMTCKKGRSFSQFVRLHSVGFALIAMEP